MITLVYDRALPNGEFIGNGMTFTDPETLFCGNDPFAYQETAPFKRSHHYPNQTTFLSTPNRGLWPVEFNAGMKFGIGLALQSMLPETQKAVQRGQIRIFFRQDHEGEPIRPWARLLHDLLGQYDIPPDHVLYSTSNMIQEKEYITWCESNGIGPDRRIHIFSYPHFYRGSSLQANALIDRLANLTVSFDNHPRHFKFICLNRRWKDHRWYVVSELHHRKLLSHGLVSCGPSTRLRGPVNPNIDTLARFPRFHPSSQLMERIPLIVDTDKFHINMAFEYDDPNFPRVHPTWAYLNTWFSLVTETLMDEGSLYVTEKIFKPIFNCHPFVVVGTYQTLKLMKDLGFQTFSPHIQEHYDEISNTQDRAEAVIDEVERLCKEDLNIMYRHLHDVIEFNFNHLQKTDLTLKMEQNFWDWLEAHNTQCMEAV